MPIGIIALLSILGLCFTSTASAQALWPYSFLTADGGCVPSFPEFMTLSALGGYELGTRATARLMAGPAYAAADEPAFAWVARLDATVPVVWHLSLALSSRAGLIPGYRGDAFRIYAFGLGLRVQ